MAENKKWRDHPSNPLVEAPWPQWILADPTVLTNQEGPDGQWHLFAYSLLGIYHYVSTDGIEWKKPSRLFFGLRPFVMKDNGDYYLFYERPTFSLHSAIAFRKSPDLKNWSVEKILLAPSLKWEGRNLACPFVSKMDDGYRLYYSANLVFLKDCLYFEPRYIGMATAKTVDGHYEKYPSPIIQPDSKTPWCNLGSGSIKVYPNSIGGFTAYNNGIYSNPEGQSSSAIRRLTSADGLRWSEAQTTPIIIPEGTGWKRAFVYAFDVKKVGKQRWLYYNARDGWVFGRERIGLAICDEEVDF